jgi:hypothetical protein
MGLFTSILDKLGFGYAAAAAPITVVDVVGQLNALAAKNPEKLN